MGGDASDTLQHLAGYGVGALSALTSLRGGGLQNYILNRQKALADPAFRATLIDSPFTSGEMFQGLTEQPAAPGTMPAAGAVAKPGDAVPAAAAAPAVAGPSDLMFLAAQTPGRHSIPALSPLSAEQQVGVQAAQGIVSGLQSTDPAIRGMSKVAGKIPLTGAEQDAVVHAGIQRQAGLGPGGTVGVEVPGMPVTIGSPYSVSPLGEEEFPTPEQAIAASNAHGWGGRIGPTIHGGWRPIPPPSPAETLPPPPGAPGPSTAPGPGPAPAPGAATGPVIRGTIGGTGRPAPPPTPMVPGPTASAGTLPPPVIYPEPQGFVFHHSGGTTLSGLTATLADRGLGSEYVMDRDGSIYSYAGQGSPHMQPNDKYGGIAPGLTNKNALGMEVVAKDNNDVTPAQIASARDFIAKNYPNTPVYGHGEVNPGHKQASEGMAIVGAIRGDRGVAVTSTPVSQPSLPGGGGVAYAAAPPPGATVQQPPPPAPAFDREAVVPHVVMPGGDTGDGGGAVGYPSAAPAAPGLPPLITVPPPAAARPAAGIPAPAAGAAPQMPAPAPVLPGIPTEPKSGQPLESETHQYTGGVTQTYHEAPRGSTDEQGLMRWAGITDMLQATPAQLEIYNGEKRFLAWRERMDSANVARISQAPSETQKSETEHLNSIRSAVEDLESDPRFDTPEKRAHYVGWATYPKRVIQQNLNSEDAATIADFRRLIAPLAPSTFEADGRNQVLAGPDLQLLAPLALNPYVASQFESNLQGLRDVSARQIAFHAFISGLARDNPAALDDPRTLQYFNDQYRQAQQQQSAAPAPAAPPVQAAPQPAAPPPTASRPWAPTTTWVVQ